MLKKTSVLVFLIILTLIFFAIYQQVKIPSGVTPQSENAETIASLALWASIISLITAIISFIQKILEILNK